MPTWLRYVSFSVAGAAIVLVALFAAQGPAPRAQALNDNVDQATIVSALPFEDSVDVNSAVAEPGEPRGSCFFEPQLIIWYKYTASADGVIAVDTTGTNFMTGIAAYTRSGSHYTEVSCGPAVPNGPTNSTGAHALIRVTNGETYYIQAVGWIFPGLPNKLRILIDTGNPPVNDDVDRATIVGALPFEESVNVNSATLEPDEPSGSCFFFEPQLSIWYKYTASVDGVVTANAAGSNFTTALAVYTRSSSHYTEVSCTVAVPNQPFDPNSPGAHATIRVTNGETYYIRAIGYNSIGLPDKMRILIDTAHPPANDNYSSPRSVTSLPFNETISTLDATSEPYEPTGRCIYDHPYASAWYRYQPSNAAFLVADTRDSNYGTVISIWTTTPFGLGEVACTNGNERLAFQGEAGRTYYIRVASQTANAGSLSFSLIEGHPPSNDNFADAIDASPLPFEHTVDTFTATKEAGEPVPSCSFGGLINTVWYKVTPQQDGFLKTFAASAGISPYTIVGVYQGSSLVDLTERTCTQPFYQGASQAGFAVSAGQTYYLQVGTLSYGGGRLLTSGDASDPAGFGGGFGPNPGVTTFHLEAFTIPPCAPPSFKVDDPVGDTIGLFGPPPPPGTPGAAALLDVTSVSGGSDGQNFCLRVEFAGPIPSPQPNTGQPTARLEFDTDSNTSTGYGGNLEYRCPGGPELGVEVAAYFPIPTQPLVPLELAFPRPVPIGGPQPVEQPQAFATFGDSSFQLIIPLSALGGDDSMHFGLLTESNAGNDCVPNGGGIVSPVPAPMGDVNCDGTANTIDVTLILQQFAGLLTTGLPCQYVGDVNHNGSVGPIDATLILQYTSGMLPSFPAGG